MSQMEVVGTGRSATVYFTATSLREQRTQELKNAKDYKDYPIIWK
jgi:hypothetical protein